MRAGQAMVRRAAPVARKETPKRAAPAGAPEEVAVEVKELRETTATERQVTRVGFAPIVRVDEARREVELCATSEALDSHGTIFDYAASKDAFTRWLGNVREMHERRAVGRRAAVRFDDATRKVFVRVHISRGAEDTWEKILDGTLRGASIGASNVVWERQTRRVGGRDRRLNVATRYDLVELSLVDNPSNPDALGVTIVRDAAPDPALLDEVDELEPESTTIALSGVWAAGKDAGPSLMWSSLWSDSEVSVPPSPHGNSRRSLEEREVPHRGTEEAEKRSGGVGGEVRALGAFSTNTEGYPDTGVPAQAEARPTDDLGMSMTPEGNLRARFHAAARSILLGCGCPLCAGAIAALGETGDTLDEAPAGLPANRRIETRRESPAAHEQQRDQRVEVAMVRAVAAGLQASATQLERMDVGVQGLRSLLGTAVNQMSGTVGDLKLRLEALEAQPLPGGPAARVAEKTLALASPQGMKSANNSDGGSVTPDSLRALEALAGRLRDPQAQIAVAAELIRLQREG